jgi:hypothetical protein
MAKKETIGQKIDEAIASDKFCKGDKDHCCKKRKGGASGSCGAIYGLGLIGAAVYFIQHAPDFWMGVLGLIKAIFWPALFVYKALELLKF